MLTFLPPVAFARGAARRPVGELCKKAPWKLPHLALPAGERPPVAPRQPDGTQAAAQPYPAEGVRFERVKFARALCAVNFISVEWHCADKFLPHKLEASDGSAIRIQNNANAVSKRNALLAALKSQATEATCAGHFELSNIDDESYWNHRSFADLIN